MRKVTNMNLKFEDVVQIIPKADNKVAVVINYDNEITVYNRKMHPIGHGNKMVNLNNNRVEFTPDYKLIAVKKYANKRNTAKVDTNDTKVEDTVVEDTTKNTDINTVLDKINTILNTDSDIIDDTDATATDTTCKTSDSVISDDNDDFNVEPMKFSKSTVDKIIKASDTVKGKDVSDVKYDINDTVDTIETTDAIDTITKSDNIDVTENAIKRLKDADTDESVKKVAKIEVKEIKKDEIRHAQMDNIKSCIDLNIPVYLYGPAGSGKNYTVKKIAEELNLDFYFTNSVQQEYKITGFIDAGGVYHETEFYKAFKNGGLFMLDEMDASIPEVLVLLNAAIANGYFEFPCGRIDAHENFRVIAAGNTIGNGADTQYTGRMVLDSSTLDRFVIIEFNYDERIEMNIANDNKDLVEFIHFMREQNEMYNLNCTFSYRCLEYITKLEKSNMELITILQISIVKGLKKDDISVLDFRQENMRSNKYAKAMIKLAA